MGNIKQINIKMVHMNFLITWLITNILIQTYWKYRKVVQKYCSFYIGYITVKDLDYLNIHSKKALDFIINEADGYIGETKGHKYLVLVSTDKTKTHQESIQNYGIKLKIWLGQ